MIINYPVDRRVVAMIRRAMAMRADVLHPMVESRARAIPVADRTEIPQPSPFAPRGPRHRLRPQAEAAGVAS